MEYVITFKNTNLAIKSEQCLLEQNISVGVLPLPSQISAGCGICLRISRDEIRAALKVLAVNNIDEISLFLRSFENGQFSYMDVTDGNNIILDEE